MAINLQKGQREAINAPKFIIGLGWDTNSTSTGTAFDLDASVFVLGENRKLLSDGSVRTHPISAQILEPLWIIRLRVRHLRAGLVPIHRPVGIIP